MIKRSKGDIYFYNGFLTPFPHLHISLDSQNMLQKRALYITKIKEWKIQDQYITYVITIFLLLMNEIPHLSQWRFLPAINGVRPIEQISCKKKSNAVNIWGTRKSISISIRAKGDRYVYRIVDFVSPGTLKTSRFWKMWLGNEKKSHLSYGLQHFSFRCHNYYT